MIIKGRYVAQIVIDFDMGKEEGMLPFEEIKKRMVDGELTDMIKRVVTDEVVYDYGTVSVTQQYADLYEVEKGRSEE